jgi:hypothetical protein
MTFRLTIALQRLLLALARYSLHNRKSLRSLSETFNTAVSVPEAAPVRKETEDLFDLTAHVANWCVAPRAKLLTTLLAISSPDWSTSLESCPGCLAVLVGLSIAGRHYQTFTVERLEQGVRADKSSQDYFFQ